MERLVTVEFGPSRSKRFGKALAEAQNGPGECSELEPGRYRTRFVLGTDSATYTGLARLLERVRHWRATEVCEDDEPVSAFHAKEMAWCASFELKSFRACRFHFGYGVLPRCSVCPLFDAERAIRDVLGENPPPANVVEITLGPNLLTLLRGELPPSLAAGVGCQNSVRATGQADLQGESGLAPDTLASGLRLCHGTDDAEKLRDWPSRQRGREAGPRAHISCSWAAEMRARAHVGHQSRFRPKP
jgi:hypothetical protein